MDIVDSQHHLFHVMDIEQSLAAMDGIGISGAVVDEYWRHDGAVPMPAHTLSHGVYRPFLAGAALASSLHPSRFCHLLRLHPEDPMLGPVVQLARAHPGSARFDATRRTSRNSERWRRAAIPHCLRQRPITASPCSYSLLIIRN